MLLACAWQTGLTWSCHIAAASASAAAPAFLPPYLIPAGRVRFIALSASGTKPTAADPLPVMGPCKQHLGTLHAQARARVEMAKIDVLLVPTAAHHYTIAEILEQEAAPEVCVPLQRRECF